MKLIDDIIATPCSESLGLKERAEAVLELMSERPDQLPSAVVDAGSKFLEVTNEDLLRALQIAMFASGYVPVRSESELVLIALLVADGHLGVELGASLLASCDPVNRRQLRPALIELVETAELVCEDKKDNLMEADDDDVLVNACRNFKVQFARVSCVGFGG